jgi:hypothetical protein
MQKTIEGVSCKCRKRGDRVAIGEKQAQKHVEKQTTANKQEFNLYKKEGVAVLSTNSIKIPKTT